MKTFKERNIEVIFEMNSATFANEADVIKIRDLRVSARIVTSPGSYNEAQIVIYGLSQDVMNRLLTLRDIQRPNIFGDNIVTLRYLDGTNVTLFSGAITTAYADYSAAPNVPFFVQASSTYLAQMQAVNGLNFEGTVKVSTIMEKLAALAGKNLINNGVDAALTDQSLSGSMQDMMDAVEQAAGIDVYNYINTIAICPKGQGRRDLDPVILSKETGMVGWPTALDWGCHVTAIYSPDYVPGRKINVVCPEIPFVNGEMVIFKIVQEIDAQVPGGQWFTKMHLQRNLQTQ